MGEGGYENGFELAVHDHCLQAPFRSSLHKRPKTGALVMSHIDYQHQLRQFNQFTKPNTQHPQEIK